MQMHKMNWHSPHAMPNKINWEDEQNILLLVCIRKEYLKSIRNNDSNSGFSKYLLITEHTHTHIFIYESFTCSLFLLIL